MVDEHFLPLIGGMSFALALPFGAAALRKLRHPVRFVAVVREYRILPDELGQFAAGSVIAAELAVAVLLVSGTAIAVASAGAALLCLGFLGAVLINLRRRRDIPCGCFGDDERISVRTVARLLVMTGASIATLAGALLARDLSLLSNASQLLGRAAVGVPIALLGSWIVTLPELTELRQGQPEPAAGAPADAGGGSESSDGR